MILQLQELYRGNHKIWLKLEFGNLVSLGFLGTFAFKNKNSKSVISKYFRISQLNGTKQSNKNDMAANYICSLHILPTPTEQQLDCLTYRDKSKEIKRP